MLLVRRQVPLAATAPFDGELAVIDLRYRVADGQWANHEPNRCVAAPIAPGDTERFWRARGATLREVLVEAQALSSHSTFQLPWAWDPDERAGHAIGVLQAADGAFLLTRLRATNSMLTNGNMSVDAGRVNFHVVSVTRSNPALVAVVASNNRITWDPSVR